MAHQMCMVESGWASAETICYYPEHLDPMPHRRGRGVSSRQRDGSLRLSDVVARRFAGFSYVFPDVHSSERRATEPGRFPTAVYCLPQRGRDLRRQGPLRQDLGLGYRDHGEWYLAASAGPKRQTRDNVSMKQRVDERCAGA